MIDQVLYAHFKVSVLSSESFLFKILCHCSSNDHDFTLPSQTNYTLILTYGIAILANGQNTILSMTLECCIKMLTYLIKHDMLFNCMNISVLNIA